MSRSSALTYLQNKYASLATYTGQATTDTDAGYGPAIDDALLTMGVAHSSLTGYTVADGLVRDYRVLLRVYALRQFEDELAGENSFDFGIGTLTTKRNAQLIQVQSLLAEAEKEATTLGYVLGSSGALKSGRLNLDFLEPAPR